MNLKQTIGRINEPNPSGFYYPFNNKKYVFVYQKNLIYSLDPTNLELSAFYFNEKNIKELSSMRLPLIERNSDVKAAIACSSDETKIYVFTSVGMWEVDVQTYLTKVEKISDLSGFDSTKNRLDDLIHGAYGYLIGINKLRSVYIIPENMNGKKSEKFL